MKYSEKLDKIIYPIFKDYEEVIIDLEGKLETIILISIQENGQTFNYHFQSFQKQKNTQRFNYIFYKYSINSGFKFLKNNERYEFLKKLLYFEIQEILNIKDVMSEINES